MSKLRRPVPAQERFKSILEDFIECIHPHIVVNVKHNRYLNLFRLYIANSSDSKLIVSFINNTYSKWHMAISKNVEIIKSIFLGVLNEKNINKLDSMIILLEDIRISQAEKDKFWKIMTSLIRSSIHYLNDNDDSRIVVKYNVDELNTTWNIDKNLVVYVSESEESDSNATSRSEDSSES